MAGKSFKCSECLRYSPHPIYPFIMICLEDCRVVSGAEECSGYIKRDFDELAKLLLERGVLYCADCRQPIYSQDELPRHAGDRVIAIFPPDDVSYEESPAAD